MTRVVVVGDALLDVVVRPSLPVRVGADVPARISIRPGGQGANLAVRLARQGVETVLICGLGDDAAATVLRDAMEADGVELSPVPVEGTGSVVIMVDEAGERTMLSQRSPFGASAAARVPPDAAWIVVSGYLLLEADAEVLARSLAGRDARRVLVGCAVSKDLGRWLRAAVALEPAITVLNREEAAALRATPDFVGGGLVVTDAAGAVATIGAVRAETRTAAGQPPVDTTGAGDAFAAGLVASLSKGTWPPSEDDLERALAAAADRGAAVARTPGAQGRIDAETAPLPR